MDGLVMLSKGAGSTFAGLFQSLGDAIRLGGRAFKQGELILEGAGGFAKVGIAVRAVGTAMKAMGIGLIIAAFLALKEAFKSNARFHWENLTKEERKAVREKMRKAMKQRNVFHRGMPSPSKRHRKPSKE